MNDDKGHLSSTRIGLNPKRTTTTKVAFKILSILPSITVYINMGMLVCSPGPHAEIKQNEKPAALRHCYTRRS